jgi:zinc finger SWIM domain-containing protein 3
VIHQHLEKFLLAFKRWVYEDKYEFYFNKKWDELLCEYNLKNNKWMLNLYDLRKKWATMEHDSFTTDMNSTQRSDGMNNIFKKRFRRKLDISELLEECDKVSPSLRNNELDEDFQSRQNSPVTQIPLLKATTAPYTRMVYKEFEEEFNEQVSFSCKLLHTECSILTYTVTHTYSDYGATVVSTKQILQLHVLAVNMSP